MLSFSAGGFDPQHLTLAFSGTYVIRVVATGTEHSFYSLGLLCQNPAEPATPVGCGTTISSGPYGNAGIPVGNVFQYAFAGQAGGNITLNLTGAAYESLFDPSGNQVLNLYGSTNQRQVTLAWTGTYVVQAYGLSQPQAPDLTAWACSVTRG